MTDWFKKLFIDEAMSSLRNRSSSGTGSTCSVEIFNSLNSKIVVYGTGYSNEEFKSGDNASLSNIPLNSIVVVEDLTADPTVMVSVQGDAEELTGGGGFYIFKINGDCTIFVESHGLGGW